MCSVSNEHIVDWTLSPNHPFSFIFTIIVLSGRVTTTETLQFQVILLLPKVTIPTVLTEMVDDFSDCNEFILSTTNLSKH